VPHLARPWGRDADALDQVLIHQEFAAAKITRPDLALAAWMVPSLVAHGTAEQQQRYLPATLRGEHFWCQLFSEPGAGSDLAALTTKAVKVEGGWRLTGAKVWNSLAQFSDMGFCLARTNPNVPKHNGISYFLVNMKAEGVTVRPLKELTGSALFNEVFLENVFVADEDVVGEVDHGWEVARNTLSNERVSLGNKELPLYASTSSLLKWARGEELDALAVDRVGQLIADGHAVRILNQRATILQLDGADPGTASSVSKLLNMRFGQDASEFVQAEFGHAGAIADESTPAGKWASYLLAGRATTIYGGTSEIQLNIIAERILGLPRDPAPAER
jgi:3-oxochol-4-en-24-oyl-CoA dehydrogenase